MAMDSTENRDGNEHVNVAENVVGTTAGVVYMKLLEFFDAMIVLIGVVNCSTNQPFLKIWEWQNSFIPIQVTNVQHLSGSYRAP